MKKVLVLIALFFSTASISFAAVPNRACTADEVSVYSDDFSVLLNCLSKDNIQKDSARAIENSSSAKSKLPVITQKTVITDGQGHFDFCPSFYRTSCVITNPAYHAISMTWDALRIYFPFVDKF